MTTTSTPETALQSASPGTGTHPSDGIGTDAAASPGTSGNPTRPRFWPAGFQANPLRFVVRGQLWRAVTITLALAVIFLPELVTVLILLPWLPLSARAMDVFGRVSARWLRVPVSPRTIHRWFDWRQVLELIGLLAVSLLAFLLTMTVGLATVVVAVVPLVYRAQSDGALQLGFWETSWPPAVFSVCWAMALVGLVVFLYLAWVVAGCSVAVTVAANTTRDAEIATLTRSREVLVDAFTGERKRIERELHDGVQQYLTALQLNVATMELTARSGGDITEVINEVKTNARQALDALRDTVRGIYPQVLADKGLVEAVRELVAHSGVDGEVIEDLSTADTTNSRPQLSGTPALLLYHCVAEGLTNAVTHGGATAVLVTIQCRGTTTALTVTDNGSGLSATASTGGTGVAGLTERAAALGGTVTLSSAAAPWRTTLEMRLP